MHVSEPPATGNLGLDQFYSERLTYSIPKWLSFPKSTLSPRESPVGLYGEREFQYSVLMTRKIDLGQAKAGRGSPSFLPALRIILSFYSLLPPVSSIYGKVSCRLVLYYQCSIRVTAPFKELNGRVHTSEFHRTALFPPPLPRASA